MDGLLAQRVLGPPPSRQPNAVETPLPVQSMPEIMLTVREGISFIRSFRYFQLHFIGKFNIIKDSKTKRVVKQWV